MTLINDMTEEFLRSQVEDCAHYESDIFSIAVE